MYIHIREYGKGSLGEVSYREEIFSLERVKELVVEKACGRMYPYFEAVLFDNVGMPLAYFAPKHFRFDELLPKTTILFDVNGILTSYKK